MITDSLYYADKRDAAIFGNDYCGPEAFKHGEWHLVARFAKDPADSDGQVAEVYECRLPARFFKLIALPDTNSVGEPVEGFSLSTGSGDEMGVLMRSLAKAVSAGMVGYHTDKEQA